MTKLCSMASPTNRHSKTKPRSSIFPENFSRRLTFGMHILDIANQLLTANVFFKAFLPIEEEDWEENKLEETIEKLVNCCYYDKELKDLKSKLRNDFPKGRLTTGKMLTKNVYNEKKEKEILFNVSLLLTNLKQWMKRYYRFAMKTGEYPNTASFYSHTDGNYKKKRDTLNSPPHLFRQIYKEIVIKESFKTDAKEEEEQWLTFIPSLIFCLLYKNAKELLQLHDK